MSFLNSEISSGVMHKPKAILIAVSDHFCGYGDFLFALKLSEQLKKQYADNGAEAPPIYLVSQLSGKSTIEKLKGDVEFAVEVLTPATLEAKVNAKEIEVGTLIEAPVFNSYFIEEINDALAQVGSKVPLIMIPEYGYSSSSKRSMIDQYRRYRCEKCKNIQYVDTVYSGFNEDCNEAGILLSDALLHPADKTELVSQLDEHIRTPLSTTYLVPTELSMQYSHDTYTEGQTPAAHFLNIHREYSKQSGKSQDVVMIGKHELSKKQALVNIYYQLIADGYTRISYFNADTSKEDVLYSSEEDVVQKNYRVIYSSGLSHTSMMACNALSGPLNGATGDQSLGEALSANKLMVYECLSHKRQLIDNYDAAMGEISGYDPDVIKTLKLLRQAKTPMEYEELGRLLGDVSIQEKYRKFNQALLEKYNFANKIAETVSPKLRQLRQLRQCREIVEKLKTGKAFLATMQFKALKEKISVTDSVNGKTILQYAIDNDPKSFFLQWYYQSEIIRLLKADKQPEALALLLEHEGIIDERDDFGVSLVQHARENNQDGVFVQYALKKFTELLKDGKYQQSMDFFHINKLSIFDKYQEKTLWDSICEDNSSKEHFLKSTCFLYTLKSELGIRKKNNFFRNFKDNNEKEALLTQAIDCGLYDLADWILLNTTKPSDKKELCQLLQSKSASGSTYLANLRTNRPVSDYKATGVASLLTIMNQLDKYKPAPNSKRSKMHQSFIELAKTFTDISTYDDKAFIGLLLLNKKNIASEYHWLSPRKGKFFGSKLYSICEDAMKDLGVDLQNITPKQEQEYYLALKSLINKRPEFPRNEYILQSLSKQAGINFPKIEPLITEEEAQEILVESREIITARAILEGSEPAMDPSILRTSTGFYKLNPTPIGKGGWGTVYSAQHYSLVDGRVAVSQPLAIKQMRGHQSAVLDREHQLFQKTYPDEHFEQFTKGSLAYLAMPLFAGVQLDRHLLSHDALLQQERQQMAIELLIDLDHMHKNGITHNDLKTKNILYDQVEKKMHIIDFGCAQDLSEQQFMRYQNVDTSVFAFELPPEYLVGTRAHPSQDIYTMTPIIAEILGVDKKELVTARLNKALETIADKRLCDDIKRAFNATDSLEDALFTGILYPQITSPQFQLFVQSYVATSYDFSPYQEQLGEQAIALLNAMQAKDPKDRPSAQTCLEQLMQPMPVYKTSDFSTSINALHGNENTDDHLNIFRPE